MRKVVWSTLFAVCLTVLSTAQSSAVRPEHFQFYAAIQGSVEKGKLYQLHLDQGILSHCLAGMGDIRLFDGQGREIQFTIIENRIHAEKPEIYPLEIISYAESPNGYTLLVKMPEKETKAVSEVDLEIDGHDFKKSVTLEGSRDLKSWEPLTQSPIYDFSSQVPLRKTKLAFSSTHCRYFRFNWSDGGPSDKMAASIELKYDGLDFSVGAAGPKKLKINRVLAATGSEKEESTLLDSAVFNVTPTADDKQNSVMTCKAGLPADWVRFEISDPFYYRFVKVFGGDSETSTRQRQLYQGTIFLLPLAGGKEQDAGLPVGSPWQGYYRFVIANRSNPPLGISAVRLEWVRRNLFFMALENSDSYRLYCGSPGMSSVEYDISRLIHQQNWFQQRTQQLALIGVIPNPAYSPPPLEDQKSKTEKVILTVIVIATMLGIGYWLFRMMKKTPPRPMDSDQ